MKEEKDLDKTSSRSWKSMREGGREREARKGPFARTLCASSVASATTCIGRSKGDIIAGCTHRAAADGAVWWLGVVRAVHHKGGQTANETTVLAICYLDNHRRRRYPPPLRSSHAPPAPLAPPPPNSRPVRVTRQLVPRTIPVDVTAAYLANF